MNKKKAFILWFKDITIKDVPLVGGKNASLGEMYQKLTKKGIKVPNGFAVTAYAYQYFLQKAGIAEKIKNILRDLNTKNLKNLTERGHRVRETILQAELPKELEKEIIVNYKKLGREVDVAVRSSATAEDLADASFAGQQETFLNIRGGFEVVQAVKRCMASLFTNRAISYRADKGFNHFSIYLSVSVQKMVRSDEACSGVMFSIDPDSGHLHVVVINASYGLGEMVVQGKVAPDEFHVFKPALLQGFKPIIGRSLGKKERKMVYSLEADEPTREVLVPEEEQKKFCLSDEEILQLAKWACLIEKHYGKPMDIEWAKDGLTKELYIVQARPETVHAVASKDVLREYILKKRGKVLCEGVAVGSMIGQGRAHVIKDVTQIHQFQKDEILVTEITDPDWEPIMKIAAAIVTNSGGRTCFMQETRVLTSQGFFKIKDLYRKFIKKENLGKILAYDYKQKKPVWKKIKNVSRNKLNTIKTAVSQTGRVKDNYLEITPDHRMYTYQNGQLVKKEVGAILKDREAVCLLDKLPDELPEKINSNPLLAYLIGVIITDGSIWFNKRGDKGMIVFTQKPTYAKKEFINYFQQCFKKIFAYELSARLKKCRSKLRSRQIRGTAIDYRCFKRDIAIYLKKIVDNIGSWSLALDEKSAQSFLAGMIDGDGTFVNNRINIFIQKETSLQAVVISLLKLGIVPQITTNRNIYNVQIVEGLEKILPYTKRIKGKVRTKILGTKLFAAKQLFNQIIDEVNYKGRIRPYIERNLLLDARKIKKYILPRIKSNEFKKQILNILNSSLRMQRIVKLKNLGFNDVYNIEVDSSRELEKNFIVFTKRYTPLLVSNSHAAIVSRELGIPCIVGTHTATKAIKNGQNITVSCAEGERGFVYQGLIPFKIKETNLAKMKPPKVQIMEIVADPARVFNFALIPNQGVGLAREELIILNHIKIHPLALLRFNKLKDEEAKKKIAGLTTGYKNKADYFVDKLAEGVGRIVAAFWPHDVIVRMSDFKTNEYANLIGGRQFEPHEENPMIGWRGASRYYSKEYKEAFVLECRAFKKVREEMGLKNMKIMLPFVRTPEEAKKVIRILAENGLKRGQNDLELYMMCEVPSNVILADQFAPLFDGFSIGSNDLTQLTLGLDRDSGLVAHIYDERNEAVKRLIADVIKTCHKHGVKIGLCGQAPSDFPEMAKFLVDCGIDSFSLTPDTVLKTTVMISQYEQRKAKATSRRHH